MYKKILFSLLFSCLLSVSAKAVEIEKVTGKNGVEAWLVEDHTNPIITVSLAFRGGSALDPKGKEGVSNFVSGLLDEGAGELDSQAFRGKMEDLSISLSFRAGLERFTGTLATLSKNKDEAFNLLRLALTKPRFNQEAVTRIRSQIQASLKQASQNPNVIASVAFEEALFPNHPYSRPTDGTEETLATLTVDDLKEFVKKRLAKDNLIIGVVGDITPQQLAAVIDKTFSDLPDKAAPWELPEVLPAKGNKPIIIDRPIPQSVIRVGQVGVKRKHKDFYPAYVLNYILGGGSFSSRLYKEIREKRGLAYSPYSYLYPMNSSSLFAGGAGTANERVGETVDVLLKEWRRMETNGATAEEVNNAKTYLTGSFPLRFSSSSNIASILVSMQLNELGDQFLNERNKFVEAVTLEQVNKVAKSLLDTDNLVVVIVGQPKGLKQ
ncbi:MAG: insulinase family protein [Rhodospirillales bacterium]|nr:insulinase family protein [Rhodospirillales bacterium]